MKDLILYYNFYIIIINALNDLFTNNAYLISRYSYGRDPPPHLYEDKTLERENPFFGSNINTDADSVVQLFLQKSLFTQTNNINNNNNNNNGKSVVNPGRIENIRSPISFGSEGESREETPPSRTLNTFNTRERIKQLRKSFLEDDHDKPKLNKPKPNKYLQAQSRRTSFSSVSSPTSTNPDSTLSSASNPPEGHLSSSSASTEACISGAEVHTAAVQVAKSAVPSRYTTSTFDSGKPLRSPPSTLPESEESGGDTSCSNMAISPDFQDSHYISDIVKMELPVMHHAEVVSVRKEDTTSMSDSSSSDEEEDHSSGSRNIMVNIRPASEPDGGAGGASDTDTITPRLEAPPYKQNIWGPGHRQKSTELAPGILSQTEPPQDARLMQPEIGNDLFPNNAEFSFTYASRKVRGETNDFELGPESILGPPVQTSSPRVDPDVTKPTSNNQQWSIGDQRTFQDAAIINYQESNHLGTEKEVKPKKKGFLAFFKKTNKKKNHGNDDFIQIEPRLDTGNPTDSETDDHIPDLYGDQSPRFHILPPQREDQAAPSPVSRGLFPGEHQEANILNLSQSPSYTSPNPHVLEISQSPRHNSNHQIMELSQSPNRSTNQFLELSQSPQFMENQQKYGNLPDFIPYQQNVHDQDVFMSSEEAEVEKMSFSDHMKDGETDLDEVFQERQGRNLERKLSMSKPTNLDDIMREDPKPEPESIPPVVFQEHMIPDHEKTQEIDIDALLGDECFSSEEEDDTEEMERLTRYNTYINTALTTKVTVPAPIPKGDSYYPSQKITTVNGETTFSASPEFSYMEEHKEKFPGKNAKPVPSELQKEEPYRPPSRVDHDAIKQEINSKGINLNLEDASRIKSQHDRLIAELTNPKRNTPQIPQQVQDNIIEPQQPVSTIYSESYEQNMMQVSQPTFDEQRQSEQDIQIPIQIETVVNNVELSPVLALPQIDDLSLGHNKLEDFVEQIEQSKPVAISQEDEIIMEQRRLEEEHRMLSHANLELLEQVEAKELERMKEEQNLTEENLQTEVLPPYDNRRSKPKSIFNFKKKEQREQIPVPEGEVDERRRMPKQKSKSGFSFFSAKDKKYPGNSESNQKTEETITSSTSNYDQQDIQTKTPSTKPKGLPMFSKLTSKEVTEVHRQTEAVDEEQPKLLAEDIVSEIMRSTANLAMNPAEPEPVPPRMEEPNFARIQSRTSMRAPKKKKEKGGAMPVPSKPLAKPTSEAQQVEEPELEQNVGFGSRLRSESKSRFSLKMPKKKEKHDPKVEATAANTVEKDENEVEVRRSTSPVSQPSSRPESRNRKEKPSGLAEMFGLRSSRREKSVERPKSSLFGSKSPGTMVKNRPKSSEMANYSSHQAQEQNKKISLSNYFANESFESKTSAQSAEKSHHDLSNSNIDFSLQQGPDSNNVSSQESNARINSHHQPQLHKPSQNMRPQIPDYHPQIPQTLPVVSQYEAQSQQQQHRQQQQQSPHTLPQAHVTQSQSYPEELMYAQIQRNPPPLSAPSQMPASNLAHQPPRPQSGRITRPTQPPPADPRDVKDRLDSSFESTNAGGMNRQTGRQSGRFRRGAGSANTSAISADDALNASVVSQGSNEAQSRFMQALVSPDTSTAPPLRRPPGSLGRVEGSRMLREGMRVPQPGLAPARSEESVRETGRSRSKRKEKKAGECSVM